MLVKLWRCRIIWFLFVSFKIIILCSIVCRLIFHSLLVKLFHSLWFAKYLIFAKIWFVKTSIRIVKYESQVAKSNPGKVFWESDFRFQPQDHVEQLQAKVSWITFWRLYCSYTKLVDIIFCMCSRGFSVSRTLTKNHSFKPISVQTLWYVISFLLLNSSSIYDNVR